MLSRNSSSHRASSRMSGTPLPLSGRLRVLSPSVAAFAVEATLVRSNSLISWCTEMPPLTTYLPWSPASYQPPETSSV